MPNGTEQAEGSDARASRRWAAGHVGAVVLVTLLAVAAGFGATALEARRPARYDSRAVLLIDQEPGLSLSRDAGVFDKLTRLRVKYIDTVQTTAFADRVSTRTGVPSTRVQADLTAFAAPVSLLMSVSASDGDRATAERLAQSAAEELQTGLTDEQAALQIPSIDRVTLTVVSPASPAVKTSPSSRRAATVGGVVALAVLGGGLVVVAAVRRRTR